MTDERDPDPTMRLAQRVLLMVHELHKQGYQLLRIAPGMSPSGTPVTPRHNTLRSNGAMAANFQSTIKYSSADSNKYFGWTDAATDTARQLAEKFKERFPEELECCEGQDWEYCGWFVQVLGMADRLAFPAAYYDFEDGGDRRFMHTVPTLTNELPFPPPGEAEQEEE